MNIYPAIDLFEGKVVRLTRGDYAQKIVYSDSPHNQAKVWADHGAKWLHLVDLEGAKNGKVVNLESLKKIRNSVKCHLEFGGGIRDIETVNQLLELGIDRIIVGTKAIDGDFLGQLIKLFGSKIAVGLDVRNGIVQTQGWLKGSELELFSFLKQLNQFPLETIIYTDIAKDGMLSGPNFQGLNEVLKHSNAKVILSGGVKGIEDIILCSKIKASNFEGVIIGKALYENKIGLTDALLLTRET